MGKDAMKKAIDTAEQAEVNKIKTNMHQKKEEIVSINFEIPGQSEDSTKPGSTIQKRSIKILKKDADTTE